MSDEHYDLLVIGSGPAGQKGAICAAKLNKRVAVIDSIHMMGGVCVHTGTIPSKTLREAILYHSGFRQRTFYGKDYMLKEKVSFPDLVMWVQKVVEREIDVIASQLSRNGIAVIGGTARFLDPHTIEVHTETGPTTVTGDYILIACGTRPHHSKEIPLDGKQICDSDQLLHIEEIPRQLIVVGAGVTGLEYASMFTALNREVSIIDQRSTILDFVDREIIDSLMYLMRRHRASFRLGETVVSVEKDNQNRVIARLGSGKIIRGDFLLHTVGRQGNTDTINIEAAGLSPDNRGRLLVNDRFQTDVPHIYAAGDVIGFPALAATSMEQGRLASCHIFGIPGQMSAELLPYGIYTIPEISMVGMTEQQLTASKVPYEFGIARYEELAKGQILGDEIGLLKILFDPGNLKVLGVHAIGENAAEIIHIGQAVLAHGGKIDYFRDTVFNYPTLAEAYRVAALDGLNKI
ncbi:MAG: Si-specific NAD(P)(+) transhydrogenase [Deltaproteobacteria bacterium]|nr:Si-specific NAD(P)(+) transhydrogenase [Deltaproteobacteria bacterium]